MVFCIIFNASVLCPFEVFVSISSKNLNLMQQVCQLYAFVGYTHSKVLTVKLLSALRPLLHKTLTVRKFFMYGKCL